MFNLSFHLPKGRFSWVHRSFRPYSGERGKSGKAEQASNSVKAGEACNTGTAYNTDKSGVSIRTGRTGRPSPLLWGFVAAAARGVSSSTADNYRTAVRSFVRFNGGRDVPLSSLDAETVRRYERWLRDRGVCPNTSSCYLRSLRALYNKAAARRLVKDRAPFKGVFTGNERTLKRSIGAEEMRRLVLCSLATPCGEEAGRGAAPASGASALDLFLFSFYAMGMPFTDLARLRKTQVKDGVLTYRRRKTNREVRVRLEPCMLHILEKYKSEDTDYLFPILYKVKDGRRAAVSYSSALNRYNRSLKTLARRAGISVSLTSYVARHSWASIAHEQGVELPVISKGLGHTDTKTTLIYIEGIKDERLAEANRELLERFSQATSYEEVYPAL